ncbi:MAG TPA: glycogen/starch synthase [Pyrinomonadaceae bacterium]|nr:glycogen/starch synthase [Pyrinomonadaceae bacterium]
MRVAILSSEAVPFAKTGGLGDVAGALPKALTRTGDVDAALIMPLYEQTKRELVGKLLFDNLEVEWTGGNRHVRVWLNEETVNAPAFLIESHEYFARPNVYGYRDDHMRFAFFCRAALALLKRLGRPPDIVHGNDWPCGFAVAELRARRAYDDFYKGTRTLFSIHNLAYQGAFDPGDLGYLGFGWGDIHNAFLLEGAASALKAGLMLSDALSTVSRRYAYEIQTSAQGYGLDWLLRMRRDRLIGVTNGVDYDAWNPATDPHIAAHFSADDLSGKRECKLDLLRRFHLPEELDRPIIAIISRLVAQKGYDLIQQAAPAILETGAFFIALGAGAQEYEDFLQSFRDHAPHRVGIYKGYAGEPLAHQIEAGADIFLMPSLYEPCGLNQMYSMRYGTVPVVRATGGLDDTVENFDRARGTGNGFKFGEYSARAMLGSIYEALFAYADKDIWRRIQLNGMREDNSWDAAARKYVEVYRAVARM